MIRDKNFVWHTIGTTLNSFLSLFLLVNVTRINGLEASGNFSFIFTLTLILQLVSNFGGRIYQISDLKEEFSFQEYLGSRLKTTIISIILLMLGCFLFKFDNNLIILAAILMIFRIIETFSDVFYGEFQKKEHLNFVGVSLTLKSLLVLISFLIANLLTKNLYISSFSMVIAAFIVFITYDLYKINQIKKVFFAFNNKIYLKSKYIFLFSLLTLILLNVPRFIAKYTLNSDEMGYLGILMMIPTVMSLVCQFIIQPMLVKFTKLVDSRDLITFNKTLFKCNLYLIFFSIICSVLAITLGPLVLGVLYGLSFEKYKLIFVILILCGLFNGLTTILSNILTIFRETKKQFNIYIIILIINFTLCYFMSVNYNLNGTIISLLLAMILQYILFYILYKKVKKQIFENKNDNEIKCIFISNIISEETNDIKNINTISYADNLAQLELVQRLHEVYKDNLIVISAAYNDFESFNHKEDITYARGIKIYGVKNCSKNKIIYYLTIIYGYYKELIKYLKLYKNKNVIVITSSPHIFRTFPILLTRKKYNYKFIPFLIGSVELPQFKGIYGFISKFSKFILKYADGSINYVETNSIDYTTKPHVSILYSISDADKKLSQKLYKKTRKVNSIKTVLFAGALTDINSLKNLIETIKKSSDKYKFVVCGDGEYRNELEVLMKKMPNKLEYLGNVSHEKAVELEHKSDYLIVLRDTQTEVGKVFAKYALSSKLFEYLLSGTPVIVNKHDAIPKEIEDYLNIIESEDYNCVIDFLEKSQKNMETYYDKALKGRDYVLKNANYKVQGDKVIEYLNKLFHER